MHALRHHGNIVAHSVLRSRCLLRSTTNSFALPVVLCHSSRNIILHSSSHLNHSISQQQQQQQQQHREHNRNTSSSLLYRRFDSVKNFQRPWHDPEFMGDSSPQEVEQWLLSLLQSTRTNNAHENRIVANKIKASSDDNIIVYFDDGFHVDATAILRVLESFARSNCPGAPQKSEHWIGVLERYYTAATDQYIAIYGSNNATLGSVNPSKPTAQPQSSSTNKSNATTFQYQREKAAAIIRNLQPTVECYNSVIEVWGNDNDLISVVRSRRWLSKLEDEAKKTEHHHSFLHSPLGPNARSYDLYLHSCSRGMGKNAKVHKERAEEAEEILAYRLSSNAPLEVRPTTVSFNYVLRAWTRCRKDMSVAGKVMNLVLLMEKIQKEYILSTEMGLDVNNEECSWKQHVAPDTKTYTMALDAWVIKAGLTAEKWRTKQLGIINTNKQRGEKNAPLTLTACEGDGTKEMEKAETILKYIRDLDCVGHSDVRATVIGYNTILSGYARLANELRLDIPFKSEKILHEMIALAEDGNGHVAPDVLSFNAVIKAWGKTKQTNSADRCEFWLTKMIDANRSSIERGEQTSVIPKPDVTTYNLCMEAHFQLGDASRVQDLLMEMDSTNGLITPNSESFSKVIRAWLNDELNMPQYGLPGSSLMNAWNWLNELLNREKQDDAAVLGPAPELFSSILKTAARTNARGENLLMIGKGTFWALKKSRFQVDHLAYAWLLEIALKVLSSQNDDERREEFLRGLFEQVCIDGLLSSTFLKKLTDGPFYEEGWTQFESERLRYELLGESPFPTAWSRNVKDEKHRPSTYDIDEPKNEQHSELGLP